MNINNLQQVVIDTAYKYDHEFIYKIINNFILFNPMKSEKELKPYVLLLKIFLEKNIIKVHDPKENFIWNSSPNESIKKIKEYWFEGASYTDFYEMPAFSWTKKFSEKIEQSNYNSVRDWDKFVENTPWLKGLLSVDENEFIERLKEV